jgi:hypothetical protein
MGRKQINKRNIKNKLNTKISKKTQRGPKTHYNYNGILVLKEITLKMTT